MARVQADDPDRDWHEPGVFEVQPGTYRIPLPMPNDGLTAVNVYALVDDSSGDTSVTLIDGGWNVDEAWTALSDGLRTLQIGPREVDQILVTHVHRDHYTLAVRLQREFGTHIALGIDERDSVRASMDTDASPFTGRLAILHRAAAQPIVDELLSLPPFDTHSEDWGEPDEWLQPSTRRVGDRELEFVPTPGHTRGHLVFVDATADVMFTGDHILPRITPSLGLEGNPGESPLEDFLTSLQRVADLPDRRMLPAHGAVAPSVRTRAYELLQHHAVRLDAAQQAVAEGASSAFEVAQRLRWTRRERTLDELDLFNRMLAVSETVAHLLVLVAEDRLRCADDSDGVRRYTT